jgi:hypothetical protein
MFTARSLVLISVLLGSIACAGTDDANSLESSQSSVSAGPFSITLASATPTVNLAASVTVGVAVTPAQGFTGTVDLKVTGLPTGVTAAPVSVPVATGAATATIVLTAAATAYVTPVNTTVPITIVATSGDGQATATANFTVAPKITIHIPNNVEALYNAPGGPLRAEWGEAFGPNNQPLRTQVGNPIEITIFNDDDSQHIIHGPNAAFPHGDFNAPIQPNAFEMKNGAPRVRTMKVGDSATAYIHGEPNSTNASFKVVIAATP